MQGLFIIIGKNIYLIGEKNLELEYISKSVQHFSGLSPDEVEMSDLLALAIPSEVEKIQLKEKIIRDFYLTFLSTGEMLDYKVVYSYKMKDHQEKERIILHQASALSLSENGVLEHVFSVHTDISYLNAAISDKITFVHMNVGKSYYNLDISKGIFDPSLANRENLKEVFSPREKEVIRGIAKGDNAQKIAEDLFISPHTVKTHRKNILQKSGCKNTAELVAKCVIGGVIDIA